jgi:hypothetical protein
LVFFWNCRPCEQDRKSLFNVKEPKFIPLQVHIKIFMHDHSRRTSRVLRPRLIGPDGYSTTRSNCLSHHAPLSRSKLELPAHCPILQPRPIVLGVTIDSDGLSLEDLKERPKDWNRSQISSQREGVNTIVGSLCQIDPMDSPISIQRISTASLEQSFAQTRMLAGTQPTISEI